MKLETRKTIALASMAVLAFVVLYGMIKCVDIPDTINSVVIALVGYIGYYFGKSTALDKQK